jgi:hypothetical protein
LYGLCGRKSHWQLVSIYFKGLEQQHTAVEAMDWSRLLMPGCRKKSERAQLSRPS